MGKIRVYELSKELGVTNKEVINVAKKYGLELKSHASAIEEQIASKIKEKLLDKNGADQNADAESNKEEVKVFKNETGQEVVERRTGSKVVLRKKKKVAEPEKIKEEETSVELKDDVAEAEKVDDKLIGDKKIAAEPEERVELKVDEVADIEESQKPVEAETPELEAGAQADTEADEKLEQEVADAGVEEKIETKKDVDGKEVPADDQVAAKEAKKKKKAKRVKISKEEVIDEDTMEELRRAFRTKLPSRKKEYVVEDRKFKSKQQDHGRRDRSQQRYRPADSHKDSQNSKQSSATVNRSANETVEKKPVKIGESITVSDLAKKMSIKGVDVIRKLMQLGTPATINQVIDNETATIIAEEYGYKVEIETYEEDDFLIDLSEESDANPVSRPPVVTVMGHVDHGKTTLLDSIRETSVVDAEAGGITQHIGAYKVNVKDRTIVFVDTPGHEAFTSMRARGASITDIVIILVAADDGVMPQTIEAIDHAKAAEVPLIVAINKIDKENSEPEKVKRQLSEHGLISEEWGGDTLFAEVSAKSKKGIEELLELIILQADLMELKVVADKRANGVVLEAELDKGRGALSTMLITEGTLRVGDIIVSGVNSGKVRALADENGKSIKEAGPSIPVEVMGLSAVPEAGEKFYVVKDEKTAKEIVSHREDKLRVRTQVPPSKISLEELFENLEEEEIKELFLLIKADTQGSVEALKESIEKLGNEKCKVSFVHTGVGGINESDIVLASASNAVVVGFNVRPDTNALKIAETEGVSLELHSIIYDVVNRIKNAMEGLLEPIVSEKISGHAEVKETFHISKIGTIAGCMVSDGIIQRDNNIRVLRDSVVIYDGKLESLKRFKDDVKEVQSGYECGLSVTNFNDIKVGDVLELYYFEETKQEL
ncbi:MAG: translation initiation factor IF-2 [Thermodesulfobacteriota bacterium]